MRTFALALSRALSLLFFSALCASSFGCSVGEGERCNPDRTTDECASGLACTTPADCVISVCCPTSGKSTDPGCAACPSAAGDDASTDAPETSPDASPEVAPDSSPG